MVYLDKKHSGLERIGSRDVAWNLVATVLQFAAGLILLPFILRMLGAEQVGIWQVFSSIIILTNLLDFGFNPSFSRNISYIFSGVKELRSKGISEINENSKVDYSLLKATIKAMKWFYSRSSVVLFILLLSLGTLYISNILQDYSGNKQEVYIAWILLCVFSAYNLYTLYYDSLLQGKGMVKRSKQIRVVGQLVYLVLAVILIYLGQGLIAIMLAQLFSLLVKRIISYRAFYTKAILENISKAPYQAHRPIVKLIFPNAFKVGLTSVGAYLINQASILIAPLYISLTELASYGTTVQIIGVITAGAQVYFTSFTPKIFQYTVERNLLMLRKLYFRSISIFFSLTFIGGLLLVLLGPRVLELISSQTTLLAAPMMIVALIIASLEKNHAIAGTFLLSKNEVPFFKAALISGLGVIVLLFVLLKFTDLKVWAMILAPGIVQLLYQNWKWPMMVMKELYKNKRNL